MADLSQTDLDWIRDWVGSTPSDDALADMFADVGKKEAVAWRVLSRRRANLLASPASVNLPGTIAVSNIANISALNELLQRLAPLAQTAGVDIGGLDATPASGRIQRCDTPHASRLLDALR